MSDTSPEKMERYESAAVHAAKAYYDSEDADHFYSSIWGGEDIHIGIYHAEQESIFAASRRSIRKMAARLPRLKRDERPTILDIGAGYGGAARFLAGTYGCKVVALNLSHVQNRRSRELTARAGLHQQVSVVEGSFECLPFAAARFDVVWSQDALLHSANREKVLEEVARVSKRGGDFVFTDPMQADDCPSEVLQPILDRLDLRSLASPSLYRRNAERLGWVDLGFEDYTSQLVTHYERILEETIQREDELRGVISSEFIARTKAGLMHWIRAGKNRHLVWGIFHFRV